MSKAYGPCVSKQRALEVLTDEIQDHLPKEKWGEYERTVNRVRYEFAKLDALKPVLYKAQRRQYDYWKCGNCLWFNGENGDGIQFCDEREEYVHESARCSHHVMDSEKGAEE